MGKSLTAYALSHRLATNLDKQFVDYDDDIAGEILTNPTDYFTFIDLRLTECEPSDLTGIPKEIDDSIRYKPLLWARVLSKTSGVLLIDELTKG